MEQGLAGGRRHRAGGILSLAAVIDGHGRAFDYDLWTKTGARLSDLGSSLTWYDLLVVANNLGADSATYRAINGDTAAFDSGVQTAHILADVYDAVAQLAWMFACANTPKRRAKPKHPKPYPRPWVEPEGEKRIGREPIPVSQFDDWWNGRL